VTFTGDTQFRTAFPSAMPAITSGGLLSAGAASYTATVPGSLTNDALFLVGDTTALGSLYVAPGQSIHTPAVRKTDLIPIRSKTASSITFARAPYFTYPTATRAMTVGYNPTIDIAIDGAITLRKNGGTTLKPLLHIHGARRARFNNVTVEQISTTVDDLLAMECAGSAEITLNDCTVRTLASSKIAYHRRFSMTT
jgi:hypothetical protein